jgi:hypothetical protein
LVVPTENYGFQGRPPHHEAIYPHRTSFVTCEWQARSHDEWTETFGSERLTGALLDRLTHHVNILEMNGESYRLGQSKARQAPPKT